VGLGLSALAGCGDTGLPLPAGEESSVQGPGASDPGELEAIHERALVFLSRDPDSTIVVPWLFRTELRTHADTRERGVWFSREGSWERLVAETDSMTERRAPWSIIPGRDIRMVVGADGGLETLMVRDPTRPLEMRVGIPLAQWPELGEESVRFHRATVSVPSGEVEGYLLDLSTARRGTDPAPRDWIFLQAGDALQAALVEQTGEEGPRARTRYRAWTRWAVRERVWPDVVVEWAEVRPFERARRDIPVRWLIHSPGREMQGELESVGQALEVGEGDGPLLPVEGFIQVEGVLRVGGDVFQVTGTVHHRQR
jgi:hypothetical protein